MNLSKYLVRAGVEPHNLAQAIEGVERGMNLEKKTLKERLLAPFVIAYLVWFKLKWQDDFLPTGYENYDLEALDHIDINGDNKVWEWDAERKSGKPMSVSLIKDPLPKDDNGKELCYWAKGHHPRSRWARWVWMGMRNRAQRASYLLGDVYTPRDTQTYVYEASDGSERIEVYRNGTAWQILRNKRILGFINFRQNVGFKINNIWSEDLRAYPGYDIRMSTTAVTFSFKRWKEKKAT